MSDIRLVGGSCSQLYRDLKKKQYHLAVEIGWCNPTSSSKCKDYINEGNVGAVLTLNAKPPLPNDAQYLPRFNATLYANSQDEDMPTAKVVGEWLINDANNTELVGDGRREVTIPLRYLHKQFKPNQTLTLSYAKLNALLRKCCDAYRADLENQEELSNPGTVDPTRSRDPATMTTQGTRRGSRERKQSEKMRLALEEEE